MFPDQELVNVIARADLPQAVRLELERSAFLRGSTVAFNEKREARYIRARSDASLSASDRFSAPLKKHFKK
jgi:hypothetical protein